MNQKKQWKYYVPAIIWFCVIFRLCTMSGIDLPDMGLLEPDKFAHAGVHFILVSLTAWGAYKNGVSPKKMGKLFLLFALGSALYGMSLEFIQDTFFPGRSFDWFDAVANSIGAFLGMLVAKVWFQKKMGQFV